MSVIVVRRRSGVTVVRGGRRGPRGYTGDDASIQPALDAIAAEAAFRSEADSAEASDRADADSALSADIADEASDRDGADSVLQDNIEGEASARATAVTAEASARVGGDNALHAEVVAEAASRSTADGVLQDNLNAEVASRNSSEMALSAADTTLQAHIDSEASARATADLLLIPLSQKDQANGVPSLDGSGFLKLSQFPLDVAEYKGAWDAATNSPSLVNGTGNLGDYYRVDTAGSHNFGAGAITFHVGDQAIYSGSIWERIGASDAVSSVFGRLGDVVAAAGDYDADQIDFDPTTLDADGYGTPGNAQEAVDALAGALFDETSERTDTDTDLQNQIDDEVTARTSADSTEASARATADTNEATARANADTTLQGNIDSEATTRGSADTTLQANITAEASARGTADTTLQNNINSEASSRGSADTAESSARASADTTLQTNINNEASTRGSADTTLQTNITNETNARTSADTTLQNNITSETNSRTTADTTLQTNITNETNTRSTADTTLQTNINSEATARGTGDSTNASAITAEATTRAAHDLPTGGSTGQIARKHSGADYDFEFGTLVLSDFDTGEISSTIRSIKAPVAIAHGSNVTLSGLQNLQGVTGVANLRVLLFGQTTPSENGLWLMQSGAWTHPSAYPAGLSGYVSKGTKVFVQSGTYINREFFCNTTGTITIDTTATAWVLIDGEVALTYGANIATDAALGKLFYVTLTGATILDNPTNLTPGKILIYRFKQDATGGRVISSYGSKFRFSTDLPSTALSTAANKMDKFTFMYDAIDDKLDLMAVLRGF